MRLAVLLVPLILFTACSATAVTQVPATGSASDAVAIGTTVRPATAIQSLTPVTIAVPETSATPVLSPTTQAAKISSTEAAQLAARHVVTLTDLPTGLSLVPEQTVITTNEALAAITKDPAARLQQFQVWGRVAGYRAVFVKGGMSALVGIAKVISNASYYQTSDGAAAALADGRGSLVSWSPVSAPKVGDESYVWRLVEVTGEGNNKLEWTSYYFEIRRENILIFVEAAGMSSTISFEEVLKIAQTVAGERREITPVVTVGPMATPKATASGQTVFPSPTATLTPTPTRKGSTMDTAIPPGAWAQVEPQVEIRVISLNAVEKYSSRSLQIVPNRSGDKVFVLKLEGRYLGAASSSFYFAGRNLYALDSQRRQIGSEITIGDTSFDRRVFGGGSTVGDVVFLADQVIALLYDSSYGYQPEKRTFLGLPVIN